MSFKISDIPKASVEKKEHSLICSTVLGLACDCWQAKYNKGASTQANVQLQFCGMERMEKVVNDALAERNELKIAYMNMPIRKKIPTMAEFISDAILADQNSNPQLYLEVKT